MHTEQDTATYWKTMSHLTGRSTRYLKARAWVRAMVCAVPLVGGIVWALVPA